MFVLLLSIPLAFIYGVRRYGAKALLLFFAVTFVVSNFFEKLSISTGFPCGHHHYTGSPKLIDVPIFIHPVYFGLGYLCRQVANVLLDEADTRLSWRAGTGRRVNVVALPMTAAAIMTMFDLGSDSIASTVNHLWIWERGGGVFGVPCTNYLGWWLVTTGSSRSSPFTWPAAGHPCEAPGSMCRCSGFSSTQGSGSAPSRISRPHRATTSRMRPEPSGTNVISSRDTP
ncbi:carotenoid biosynthesis protein [Nonomuraea rubra]